ncbi:MAG TPA: hypothetical protein VFW50_14775 [Streptosporangiaceae bacterium]|nr:hypothetical protein [Streptosporangiaceae bacterium]
MTSPGPGCGPGATSARAVLLELAGDPPPEPSSPIPGGQATAVLGFAVSEATGRFRQHDQSVVDTDFAELLRWLRLALAS